MEKDLHGHEIKRSPTTLDTFVLDPARELWRARANDRQSSGLVGREISVRERDGMSWAASAADRAVAAGLPQFERIALRGVPAKGGLPEITKLVSLRRLALLAQRSGVTNSFRLLGPGVTVGLVATSLAIGVVVDLLSTLVKSGAERPSLALTTSPRFLIPALLLGAASLAGQQVAAKLKLKDGSEIVSALAVALRDGPLNRELVDSLAGSLAITRRHRPRTVIIDGFDRLDSMTKAVVLAYFDGWRPRGGHEVWVLFEDEQTAELRQQVVGSMGRRDSGLRYVKAFDLAPLSDADCRRLAEHVGHPARADFRTVGGICNPSLDNSRFRQFFTDYRAAHPREQAYGGLEFFYLLSQTFGWGGRPLLDHDFLVSELSSKQLLRAPVLRMILPGTELGRGEFGERLAAMASQFGRFLETDSRQVWLREFRIEAEAGRALAADPSAFGLVDSGLVHLFWALFWYDKIRNRAFEPFWVQKLIIHLGRSTSPALVPDLRRTLSAQYFEAIMFAITGCLETSFLEDVPNLIDQAARMLDRDESEVWRRQGWRLRALCWQAHALTGDERVLSAVLQLQDWLLQSAPLGGADWELDDLFLQTLRGSPRVRFGQDEHEQAGRRHGELRALWLQMTGWAITGPDPPATLPLIFGEESPSLEGLIERTSEDLEWIWRTEARRPTVASLRRRRSGSLAISTSLIDYTVLHASLWALVTQTWRGESTPAGSILDVLEAGLLQGWYLLEAEPNLPGPGRDFVRATLAQELILLVCAGSLALGELVGRDGARQTEILREGFERLGLDEGDGTGAQRLRAIEQRMELTGLIWNQLRCPHLGSLSRLRWAQLLVAANSESDLEPLLKLRHRVLAGLVAQLGRDGYVGLLAHAVAGQATRTIPKLSANHLGHGTVKAIEGELGRQLVGELCFLTIRLARSGDMGEFDVLGDYLTSPADGEPAPLAAILAAQPDAVLPQVALVLINCLGDSDVEDLPGKVRAALVERTHTIEDQEAAQGVLGWLDLADLLSRVRTKETLDSEAVLERWRGADPDQASMALYLALMGCESASPALVEDSTRLLEAKSERINNSSWLHLAQRLAETAGAGEASPDQLPSEQRKRALRAAVDLLRLELPRWETLLNANDLVAKVAVLVKHDPGHQLEHDELLKRARRLQLEQDGLEKLPALVAEGQFFLLYWHYFEALSAWGLVTDLPAPELDARLAHEKASDQIRKWRFAGEVVPNPFVDKDGRHCLNGQFLVLGHHLFSPPWSTTPELAETRERYNRVARQGLSTLYGELVDMDSIPPQVRAILQRHRDRFDIYTPARELGAS